MAFRVERSAIRVLVVAAFVATTFRADAERRRETSDGVQFYWAGQTATGTPSRTRYTVISKDVLNLRTGDRFQFYLSPATPAFAYLLHSSTSGVQLLYPAGDAPAEALRAGSQVYLPSKTAWYSVDGPGGREHLFLLVSATRLGDLERRLATHRTAPPASRKATAQAVVEEIGRLRKAHTSPALAAPQPTMIAGAVRGTPADLAGIAVEVTGGSFYARTYVVDHK